MVKKNQIKKGNNNPEIVYDYISGKNNFYPSFKILYNSPKLIEEKEDVKIEKCLFDFLIEFAQIETKEKEGGLGSLINSVKSSNIKNFYEKRCKLISSENNTSLWNYLSGDKKMDKHLFYRIKFSENFVIELEEYKTERIDEYSAEEKMIHYFRDQNLNDIIDEFGFSPNEVSVFVVRQIEFGGDKLFEKIFDNLGQKLYMKIMGYS